MQLNLLIVDDDPLDRALLENIARSLGHRVTVASGGEEALAKYQPLRHDLVLMDIGMPGLDGIETTRRIRAQPRSRWVPIIFHSALDDAKDIIEGLEVGGDDYLVKPTTPALIRAKITSYARILGMQREVLAQTSELSAWRDMVEEQNRLGQHVVSHLLDAEGLRDPMLQWMNTPADVFSGDLVCAMRSPSDILYVMLADAAGHGLSAALSALPMTQIFYGMARKGFPIDSIAKELNHKLLDFLPVERFVAASLAAIDTRNQTIEIWNGGNPDILFLDEDGDVTMRWPSRHPPLGIVPHEQFDPATETINYAQAGEIFMCSDGIIEAESPSGERINNQGLERVLCAAPAGRRLDALKESLTRHLAGNKNHDDLSGVVIRATIEHRQEVRSSPLPASRAAAAFSDWKLDLSWGVSELLHVDVVPAVLGFMNQIEALKPHQGNLYLILAELFNNAMDHGLLGLDSSMKNAKDGFERYLDERERQLKALTEGRIEMRFHLHHDDRQPALDIRVTDSGKGFDYAFLDDLDGPDLEARLHHGRGIMLVQRLCSEVVFSGRGNIVTARYALQ